MNDEIDLQKVKALNSTASNILKTVAVEQNQAQINNMVTKIDFMEYDPTPKEKGLSSEFFEQKKID